MHIARQVDSFSYVSAVLAVSNPEGMWTAMKHKEICENDYHDENIHAITEKVIFYKF